MIHILYQSQNTQRQIDTTLCFIRNKHGNFNYDAMLFTIVSTNFSLFSYQEISTKMFLVKSMTKGSTFGNILKKLATTC